MGIPVTTPGTPTADESASPSPVSPSRGAPPVLPPPLALRLSSLCRSLVRWSMRRAFAAASSFRVEYENRYHRKKHAMSVACTLLIRRIMRDASASCSDQRAHAVDGGAGGASIAASTTSGATVNTVKRMERPSAMLPTMVRNARKQRRSRCVGARPWAKLGFRILVCCLSAVHALAVDGCKSSDGRTFASFSIFLRLRHIDAQVVKPEGVEHVIFGGTSIFECDQIG